MESAPMLIFPRVILFDMDGTLTEPTLNFGVIKKEMGIGQQPILEALAAMDPDRRRHAQAVLHRHEDAAAAGSILNQGCRELLQLLAEWKIRTALITRNSRRSATTVLSRHGLRLDVLITREDGPFKPNPAPLLLACEKLGATPAEAWMIGDGQYDVEAGIAAGIRTVWISHRKSRPFAAEPWKTAADLPYVEKLLRSLRR
jgi:HAD superfamily hydrolase (TIGR01509 family)